MRWSVRVVKNLLFLLRDNSACGGDEPEAPQFTAGAESQKLKSLLTSRISGLPGYDELYKRFSVAESPLKGLATTGIKGLFEGGYPGGEDYLESVEKPYLDVLTRKFGEAREEAWKPIQERLISENLLESGPGFGLQKEFGEETATGMADITKEWAYEGIQRQIQQKQYQDALQRGDIQTMFNMALQEEAGALLPKQLATETEMGGLTQMGGLFGQLSQEDIVKYQAAMQAYQYEQAKPKKSLGGAGAMTGMALAALLAIPTGGMSLAALPAMGTAAALGGMAGGGIGSMFEY